MDVFTFLVGGKAGEGVKKAGSVAAHLFSNMGRFIFEMDDYQSLIRGGHNYSVVSSSTKKITSHYGRADVVVCLDERSYTLHTSHVTASGIMVFNTDTTEGEGIGIGIPLTSLAKEYAHPSLLLGVGAVAILAAAINQEKEDLKTVIETEYPRGIEDNIAYGLQIYEKAKESMGDGFSLDQGAKKRPIISGNQAIALGACAGGLDVYCAYPMTPSTSILHFLAAHREELGVAVIHPENEIAVMNMAIGAAFAGARSMVGTSGGGFALMQEAFSLAGMTEAPVLCVVSSRPGPSTGVPTYTEQGDVSFALHQGHGEFPRVVASPGSISEAFSLAAQLLSLAWKFQIPAILLTEKHLSESSMTVDTDTEIHIDQAPWAVPLSPQENEKKEEKEDYYRYKDTADGISPLLFLPHSSPINWNSYEHDEKGITTEDPRTITAMHDKRRRKSETLREHLQSMSTVNTYGKKGPVIFTYGSTTMSVLESVRAESLQVRVVQPVYLEPFPVWDVTPYRDEDIITVELSSTNAFAQLLKEKAGLTTSSHITQYNGRPFHPRELAHRLQEVI
ncbi:MAG: 2-oxoacid:acceptor oxidoreductase subunit alpha [Theionarchaea archaeon]|nr:2-oxoacid:acceptor oxidoreductase subunit alpha [Theionarchaea archaeon]